jgi:hypothetical protein
MSKSINPNVTTVGNWVVCWKVTDGTLSYLTVTDDYNNVVDSVKPEHLSECIQDELFEMQEHENDLRALIAALKLEKVHG